MDKFLLCFMPAYFIAYLLISIVSKNWTIFDYINKKRKRGVIAVLVVIAAFMLIDTVIISVGVSKNISDIFLGLGMGCMIFLLQKIKYNEI